ncbi:hypothetical protein DCC62_12435 [candidate division KSB1 bacterium]|nr:MAG: hypothetical protein DCC62_12435 [candidate division KSB1 bacterium]
MENNMKTLLMFLLVSHSLYAQDFWEQTNGPTGGTVNALAINSNGDIFAGIQDGGVYRSTDNGDNWTQINSGLPTSISVLSLVINSRGDIFAGTNGSGVFRSTDNGNTWTQINSGLMYAQVFSFAINGDGDIFAGTYGIFRSTDNGNTWIKTGLTNVWTYSLAINGSGDIFAGTEPASNWPYYSVFRSTDNGNNWTRTSLSTDNVRSLVINSRGDIFAGPDPTDWPYYTRVFRSTNNGIGWSATIVTTSSYSSVLSLAINSSGDIFAGTSVGVFRSTNNGTNWTQTGLINRGVPSLAINSSGDVFSGTYDEGVFRSTDNGDNWPQMNSGLTANDVTSLAINSSGDIFASVYHGGAFRSTDTGDNWLQINNGLTSLYVSALAINNIDQVFAGTRGSGVFLSTNNGTSWTQTGSAQDTVNSLAINSSGDIFAGVQKSGVLRSTNNGTNWTTTGLTNRNVRSLAINNSNGYIFAGADNEGVFRSTNNGANWTKKISGMPTNAYVTSLAINSSGYLFAGTRNDGVFISTDDAEQWTQTALAKTWVHSLAINSNGIIFAGTENGGVFRSTDNGDNWTQKNEGLTANSVHSLAVNSDGYIFAGTWGSSVFRSVKTTIVPAPTTPTLALPPDGTVNQPTRLILTWNASIDAEKYHLQVSADPAFSTTVVDDSTITAISRQTGPLLHDTTYYWRVKAKNIGGTSAWSSVWSFKTAIAPPPAPTLALPLNGSGNHPTTLALSWNPSTGATTYRLQVSTSSTFNTATLDDSTIATNSRQIGSLAYNTTYYWRVMAKNIGGTSAWSSGWSFKTAIESPSVPVLALPVDGSGNQPTTLTLNWNPSTGATTYRLQVSTSSTFTSTFHTDDSTNVSTSRELGSLAINTTYYWRVNAKNVGGTSAWSSVWSFRTGGTAVSEPRKATPTEFSLNQNYPNPFNPSTTILYALPKTAFVRLTVINPLGNEVETLVSTAQVAGEYEIHWNPKNLASGVYLYRIQAGEFVETRKMVLMR